MKRDQFFGNTSHKIVMGVLLILISVMLGGCSGKKNNWRISSPDGNIIVDVKIIPNDAEIDEFTGKLYYQVSYLEDDAERVLLPYSPLGIIRRDASFSTNLTSIGFATQTVVDEYHLLHGKKSNITDTANEMVLRLTGDKNKRLDMIFRVYDDGVAFRYRFPEESNETYVIRDEFTGFTIPDNCVGYAQPFDDAGKYTPAYEQYYLEEIKTSEPSPTKAGWSFPMLFNIERSDYWVLFTEANLDGSYPGTRIAKQPIVNTYRVRLPDEEEGNGTGNVKPESTLPWNTPWRIIMVGKGLAPILESTLVTTLSNPSKVDSTSWIKPGKVAWSWWSESDSPKSTEAMEKYIDLAASMGWEYFLVDANWNQNDPKALQELVMYANHYKVKLIFWYNSGGDNNVVTEAPRDKMLPAFRPNEMEFIKSIGAAGIKVDFFQSDKQNMIQHYIGILEDAAKYQLMVNFHGCTLPRGWSRTYPHLMTMEAVKGAENYKFDEYFAENAPWNNVILAFTRNVVGPMDYTPVTFSDNTYPHVTTNAHELALSVVYESGWQHFADGVEGYTNVPEEVKTFLSDVPVAWDDTKFIAGHPSSYVILAREKDGKWYVGAINGNEEEKPVSFTFDFLPKDMQYDALLIHDGENRDDFTIEKISVTSTDSLDITMQAAGGFVMELKKK